MIIYTILAFICAMIITKLIKSNSYNKKQFLKQLNWYISYFGEENAEYLINDLKRSVNPIRHLNDLIRDINPELYNEDLKWKSNDFHFFFLLDILFVTFILIIST